MRKTYVMINAATSGTEERTESSFLIILDADEYHPYIETAVLAGTSLNSQDLLSLPAEAAAQKLLTDVSQGKLRLVEIGTWGDYFATDRRDVLEGHFVYEHGIEFSGWHKTGNEANLPTGVPLSIGKIHATETLDAVRLSEKKAREEIAEIEADNAQRSRRLTNLRNMSLVRQRNYGIT